MRFLIITQKIDEQDAVLGFMHGWIAEFSRQTESVLAICLEKGQVNLPQNVRVFSLGKEENNFLRQPADSIFNFQSISNLKIFKKLKYIWKFVRYIVQFRKEYEAVFVHMNPEYIVLGGIFWKLFGKTVTLWYAHKNVPWHLRLAQIFIDVVFTSTMSGFRLPSTKVKVVGQGIDVEKFKMENGKRKIADRKFRIVTVGRITPSKDYDTLVEAIEKIHQDIAVPIEVSIIGPTSVASDEAYLKQLKEKITEKGLNKIIFFLGPIGNSNLPETLQKYNLFVNMGHTGSLDKAVPEAMASGLPVLTCNEAFKDVLGPYTVDLMYPKGDSGALTLKIKQIIELSEDKRQALGEALRAIVISDHSLKSFVGKIINAVTLFQNHGSS